MFMKIEAPIADCPVILKPNAKFISCDETSEKWGAIKGELHYLRGEVIAFGYDIESKVRDLIIYLFAFDESDNSKLQQQDLAEIFLKKMDFSTKTRVLNECLKKLNEECETLIKDLDFIRKRRNRFAHELISLIPINEGLDGFTPVFEKDGKETIINQQFINDFSQRCELIANQLSQLLAKYHTAKK
jgi:hypothetical protein